MATHSSVLAWRIPGAGEPGGCCLWGHTESDTTEVTQHNIAQHLVFTIEFQASFFQDFCMGFCILKSVFLYGIMNIYFIYLLYFYNTILVFLAQIVPALVTESLCQLVGFCVLLPYLHQWVCVCVCVCVCVHECTYTCVFILALPPYWHYKIHQAQFVYFQRLSQNQPFLQ